MSQSPPSELKYTAIPTPIPEHGHTIEEQRTVDQPGSFPCRRCQTNGVPGEIMRLISYNPFHGKAMSSPYCGSGPIFVHSHECTEYNGSQIPESHLPRPFSIRAYDARDMIVDADVVQGEQLDGRVANMFQDQGVEYVHAHHAKHGCFAFKVEREG